MLNGSSNYPPSSPVAAQRRDKVPDASPHPELLAYRTLRPLKQVSFSPATRTNTLATTTITALCLTTSTHVIHVCLLVIRAYPQLG